MLAAKFKIRLARLLDYWEMWRHRRKVLATLTAKDILLKELAQLSKEDWGSLHEKWEGIYHGLFTLAAAQGTPRDLDKAYQNNIECPGYMRLKMERDRLTMRRDPD